MASRSGLSAASSGEVGRAQAAASGLGSVLCTVITQGDAGVYVIVRVGWMERGGRGVDGVERGAVGSEDSGFEGFLVETDGVDLDLGSDGPHRSMSMALDIRGGESGKRERDGGNRVQMEQGTRRRHGLDVVGPGRRRDGVGSPGSPSGPGTRGLQWGLNSSTHRQLTCRGEGAAAGVGPGCWRPAARKIGMLEREDGRDVGTRVNVQVQTCPSTKQQRSANRWAGVRR